jgi:catechol 2,3-dioxygenase-like lactoylglutathione lyase family enzyme
MHAERFGGETMTQASDARSAPFAPTASTAVVRYQVQDLERSMGFYTQRLGFKVEQKSGPVLIVARGDLHLILSGPGSSGARAMPDGSQQEAGGWNRIVLYVEDITETIAALRDAGAGFRNELEVGPGGKQILLEDPDRNVIELHEAPR